MIIDGIEVIERENPPFIAEFSQTGRILLNPAISNDWRIRVDILARVERAAEKLPYGLHLMVFEAYRSRARQQALWDPVLARIQIEHPDWEDNAHYTEASRWISPPGGFGSGHQAGAAVDVTLSTADGKMLDMGCDMQAFTPVTPTASDVPPSARKNRDVLVAAMASQGMVNYPDEWWHFCYGDRLWAEITGCASAFFAPID